MELRATIGKYLPDLVFGANDGIVTTLAVVSGVVGASLSSTVILILGFANLLADGFSMGASNVLSRRSDTGPGLLPPLLWPLGMALRHSSALSSRAWCRFSRIVFRCQKISSLRWQACLHWPRCL